MAIRVILAALSGGSATKGTIETACRLAKRYSAHLEVLHVRYDPRDAVIMTEAGASAAIAAKLIDAAERQSNERRDRAKAIFDAAVARHELPLRERSPRFAQAAAGGASVAWREEVGEVHEAVPRHARVSDLVVLGQSGRVSDRPYTDTLEETLLKGGHPVLVAANRPLPPIGDVVAVAWNDSVEAARAVFAALPFLVQAHEVHVLTAGDHAEITAAADLAEYFAWHGITSSSHAIAPVTGFATGDLLLQAARDRGADLLVMGGYGRAVWREMLFGGATRQILATSQVPLLLAH